MRYLVTGGAGFIGSNLCEALISKGDYVICLDTLLTGRMENVSHLLGNERFQFVLASACNGNDFEVDGVFHLASPTAPEDSRLNEAETVHVNTRGTLNMIRLAERCKGKMLFASSVKVLGDCPRVQAYIDGKRFGEKLCAEHGVKVARLGSVYGPKMRHDDSRVIPTFIRRALAHEFLSAWNGGEQVDSFCFVSDIVDGLIRFMKSDHVGLVEFGHPKGVSILQLAFIIAKLAKSHSALYRDEKMLVVEECHKVPNIAKAGFLLGWEPKVSIEYGLYQTIKRWAM